MEPRTVTRMFCLVSGRIRFIGLVLLKLLLVFPLSDDFNRVILTKSEEDGHSDYINASYINVREITRSCAIIQLGFCLIF